MLSFAIKIIVLVILLLLFLYDQNNRIQISYFTVSSEKIPESFHNFKILHISDLHNKEFGVDQSILAEKTKEIEPDIIVITGDFIDRKRTDIEAAMKYIRQVNSLAPVFYVPGNHEKISFQYEALKQELIKAGVMVLGNEDMFIEKNGESIRIVGINDPAFFQGDVTFEEMLAELMDTGYKGYQILLSHRPEKMSLYSENNVDLALTGHAHGGQFRFLFIKGVIAPNQGLFPKYTSGLYEVKDTKMIVSRGLGNSVIPQRIFNRPELVVITLQKE